MANVRVHVWITGQVQGVGFRFYTRMQAKALDLTGWVKNAPDGKVEAVFEGGEEQAKEMIDWCWNGTPTAEVKKVEVKWEPFDKTQGKQPEGFKDFQIIK